MDMEVVSGARAPVGWYFVVESRWQQDGVEQVRHVQVQARSEERALRKCARALSAVVGELDSAGWPSERPRPAESAPVYVGA